jgi:FSR family fosmidomycin resistance protein-like MFS transporter
LVADRFSRKAAIIGSLLLLGPAIWLLLAFPGPGAFALGALAGFIADFSLPATLTLAQGLMPGRVGVTTGLILGIGFVTAGIGVSITGAIGDRIGLAPALTLLPLLLIGALALTFFLPGDRRGGRDLRPHQGPDPDEALVPSLGPAGRA